MSLFLPLFTSRSYFSQMSLKNELSILEQSYEKSKSDLFPIIYKQFVEDGDSEIIYLKINGEIMVQDHNKLKSLRVYYYIFIDLYCIVLYCIVYFIIFLIIYIIL